MFSTFIECKYAQIYFTSYVKSGVLNSPLHNHSFVPKIYYPEKWLYFCNSDKFIYSVKILGLEIRTDKPLHKHYCIK